ncbi:MAG: NAD-dependent deacylase [Firmicutes bacterium]|nr:NAD-dependent deacylase [Bacillota bacterium]
MYSSRESQFFSGIRKAVDEIALGKVVVLTGSGISVPSGIMPFRGPGGLWEKYNPEEVAHIDNFKRNPLHSWTMLKEMVEVVESALPNAAHYSLARMEERGLVQSIITQNIDGLHQKAGSKAVIEFHGNTSKLLCLDCKASYSVKEINLDLLPPYCPACNGLLKPGAIFFGEPIPQNALWQAQASARQCRVMLIVGTSGAVEPVASLPYVAKEHGAYIIEINPEPSFLTPYATNRFLRGNAEVILPLILDSLYEKEWFAG